MIHSSSWDFQGTPEASQKPLLLPAAVLRPLSGASAVMGPVIPMQGTARRLTWIGVRQSTGEGEEGAGGGPWFKPREGGDFLGGHAHL